jgi:hypothetical protein
MKRDPVTVGRVVGGGGSSGIAGLLGAIAVSAAGSIGEASSVRSAPKCFEIDAFDNLR